MALGLKLRHDHGSNYMSGDFQDEIECLGIEASPSFVREPEGNGVALAPAWPADEDNGIQRGECHR